MNLKRPLILASNSPRRQQILKEAGFDFTVKTIATDEHYPDSIPPSQVPSYLAKKKAEAFKGTIKDEVVIAADTVVIWKNRVMGKPENEEHGFEMLRNLANDQHLVVTAVAILTRDELICFEDTTKVFFDTLSAEEIAFYLDRYKPFDKAGAYGIQEWLGMIGVSRIEGSYYNVVGFPIQMIYQHLKKYL